jgi:hypothetical protein
MQIVCTTASAGAQVLALLFAARLSLLRDFQLSPVLSTTPPIVFTMLCALTSAQIVQISAIADTTIAGEFP